MTSSTHSGRPRPGDRVRIIAEGPFSLDARIGDSGHVWIGEQGKRTGIAAAHVVSVEVLPPPEAFEPGDIVLDRLGITHIRTHDEMPAKPWRTFNGVYQYEDFPLRPLTLIARGGKPVGQV